MKISYNWLKDYLDLNIDPYELADKLSLAGLEVEEVVENRLDFEHVVVGKVLSKEKHPDADKLSLCTVDVGNEQLFIVCGAPNVAAGQTVPVAKIGADLPIGLKIRKSKIRGQESMGMICSEAELGLSDKADGIWVLPDELSAGTPLHEGLNYETDYIYDIALTPNRPDCLSHIGVAREVGAIIGKKIKKIDPLFAEKAIPASDKISVTIQCPDTCPRYSARYIENIKIGPSPEWLARRVEKVGMRSINNVVDITNYVLMETGHPLHAFDYTFVKDGKIIVRESTDGEMFTTLDGKERKLKSKTVLICDAERAVALGGIMGGLNSEVNDNTTSILLESAYFVPESVQVNSRHLGLSTEASQRFERGADPNGTEYAINRATQLLVELCGGEVFKGIVDAYPTPVEPKQIELKTEQINNLIGTELSEAEMSGILDKIEIPVDKHMVIAPTFRPDLERVADVAEEVLRLYGLNNVASAKMTSIPYQLRMNEEDFFVDRLKNLLTGMGLQEVLTGSMVSKELWSKFTEAPLYPILNPISKDMDVLRNALIPSLAQVIQHNSHRQVKDLKIFEINKIFLPGQSLSELPNEIKKLSIAFYGTRDGNDWYSSKTSVDFYDIKGFVLTLLDKISLDCPNLIYYSDSEKAEVVYDKKTIGWFGALDRKIASVYEIEEPVYVAELELGSLFDLQTTERSFKHIAKFPWVDRDIALVVNEDINAGEILDQIRRNGGKYLKDVGIFDVYKGKQVESGKRSIAFRLIFQSPDRTLSDDDVNPVFDKIISIVTKKFNAKLRA